MSSGSAFSFYINDKKIEADHILINNLEDRITINNNGSFQADDSYYYNSYNDYNDYDYNDYDYDSGSSANSYSDNDYYNYEDEDY